MKNDIALIYFRRALERAETGDIDMGVYDWAQACGYMHTYGHGPIWEFPLSDDGTPDVSLMADRIEEVAASIAGE